MQSAQGQSRTGKQQKVINQRNYIKLREGGPLTTRDGFLIIHCLVSDVPAFFKLKNTPFFPIKKWFFFFNVLWTAHLLHPTKDKYHFQGSLHTLCSSVKQPIIKYWWCKFLHGWVAAPGIFKCHFKTKILTYFLKVLCRSPAAHKDSSYICVNMRPF